MKKLLFIPMLFACYLGMGQAPGSLKIGDSYGGGIVAYILVSGDPGYDANTQHGLIAATSDQSSGILWDIGSYDPSSNYASNYRSFIQTHADGTDIGTGSDNTTKIIAALGNEPTSYAAGLARAYRGGGYSDWFLPSIDELTKIHLNIGQKYIYNGTSWEKGNDIGGFNNNVYWSSSEKTIRSNDPNTINNHNLNSKLYNNSNNAFYLNFYDGQIKEGLKSVDNFCYVRSVRYF
jgi:hypothetical protein